VRQIVERDLQFHLILCELSGNPTLVEYIRRILIPLFGFALIRMLQSHQTTNAWQNDLEYHQRILDLLQESDPTLAEHYIRYAMEKFASRAYAVWENKPQTAEPSGNNQH
jgi:DNA-binding GntR family transcriptional regulator